MKSFITVWSRKREKVVEVKKANKQTGKEGDLKRGEPGFSTNTGIWKAREGGKP